MVQAAAIWHARWSSCLSRSRQQCQAPRPASTLRSTPSTARTTLLTRRRKLDRMAKCTVSPLTDSNGASFARDASAIERFPTGGVMARRDRHQLRPLGAAGGIRERTARREGAALWQRVQRGDDAWNFRKSRRSQALDSRHRTQQAARIGMARFSEQMRRPAPASTIRPAYITATRCAVSATTARSWVISSMAMPISLCSPSAAPGSAPEWSRRARWSARRR